MANEAPEVIRQLDWLKENFTKYFLHILVLILGWTSYVYVSDYYTLKHESSKEIQVLEEKLKEYGGCRTASPFGDTPLQVTFSDGSVSYINSFAVILPIIDKEEVDDEFMKSYLNSYEMALPTMKSVIYTTLENVDVNYARKNRDKLAETVIKELNPKISKLSLYVEQFQFLEFCSPIS